MDDREMVLSVLIAAAAMVARGFGLAVWRIRR